MKAVIAQIVGRHAVLLTEDGTFVKVKDKRYCPGQQITFCKKRRQPSKMLAIAAGFAIFLLGGTFLSLERLPYSYVSIDVNPSFEYTMNWFNRVLSLRAVNGDAESIAQNLKKNGVVNQPITIAVGMTIQKLNDMQYFENDTENDVVIAVASFGMKDVNSLSGALKDSADSVLTDRVLAVTSFQTNTEKVQEAQKYHTTAGKLVIVENLALGGDGLADEIKEEWLKKPVKEILSQNGGKVQPRADEKEPELEQASDDMTSGSIRPEETKSPPPEWPGKTQAPKETVAPKKTDKPKKTDAPKDTVAPKKTNAPKDTAAPKKTEAPGNKHDQENNEKDKNEDISSTLSSDDKPKKTPAPGYKEQPPQIGSTGKGGRDGQENED